MRKDQLNIDGARSIREDGRLTLTAAQRRIWYAQQLDPGNPTYQIGQYLDLRGPVDPRALGIATTKMVTDLDALSTRFFEDRDGPFGVIERPIPTDQYLEVVDLRGPDPDEAFRRARDHMDRELRSPRSLTGDDLFGTVLFRLEGDRSLLFQRVHHIVMDGYSAVIALRYLAGVYTRLVTWAPRGRLMDLLARPIAHLASRFTSPLPSLEQLHRSLEDYENSQQHAVDADHWRRTLADGVPSSGLEGVPYRAAREVVRSPIPIEDDVATKLSALKHDLPKTVVAAVALYQSKMSGEGRIAIGLPVTARRGEVEKTTPSMMSSILPLVVEVPPSAGLADVVTQAGDVVRDAVRHQRYRIEQIDNAPNHAGTSVNLLPVIDDLDFGPARGEVEILSTGPVHDLSVVISGLNSRAAGAMLQLEGDGELYSQERLQMHAERLHRFLRRMVEAPDGALVPDVSVLAEAELGGLIDHGSGGRSPLPHGTVLDRFASAAGRQPHDRAVVAPDGSMTFAELETESTRLAHHLVSQGVAADRCVAVRIERSVYLPMLILAIMKAGGAYVPLDPEYPVGRVAAMVEDADPVLLLTTRTQLGMDIDSGMSWQVPVLAVDADTVPWRRCSRDPAPLAGAAEDDLAYVVFTSGSTGRPKGVGVEHLALHNLFERHRSEMFDPAERHLGRRLRVAHTAGLSFDAAWDPLLWLVAGHELHIISDEIRRDPTLLGEHMAVERIDALETTPSFAEALLSIGSLDGARHTTEIAVGGEAVGIDLWNELAESEDVRAVNLYGPTEATVDSLVADIEPGHAPHIGISVPNTRHYILDRSLAPVPDGAVGELYLAGANLARGYIGQPGLTSERFVADPFVDDGSRMYRTGDRVRRREGEIRFLGRLDDQVKIRGYRVELHEVEAAMRRQDHVVAAAATVQGDGAEARILGYVVLERDAPGADFRQTLRSELPSYMVPGVITELDEIPLTPNGKLDRHALPAPELAPADSSQLAATATETVIADAFCRALGLSGIAAEEDFFAAGGHSLLATRIAAELTEELRGPVTVRDIFECPTVRTLAERTNASDSGPSEPLRVMAHPDPMPLSLPQRRLWFLNRLEPDSAAYNIPIVLHLEGDLDPGALGRALLDVMRRHAPLRTVMPYVDGQPVQRILPPDESRLPFPTIDVPASGVDDIVRQESLRPFDVTRETPMRSVLLRTDERRHVLVLTVHHTACDGWSLAPLAKDLSTAYSARTDGVPPTWEPLDVEYADFTLWQRQRLGSPDDPESESSRQIAFWREALSDAPEEIGLPRDRPRDEGTRSYTGADEVDDVVLEFDADRHTAVRELAASHRTSLFMVLHAAVTVMCRQHGAGDDIVIGTPVAGRSDPKLDDLVGFFVNTVALRTSLTDDPTVEDLLQRVHTDDTEAYAHQDVPFDAVVDAVRPPRAAGRHPLFQVLLTMQTDEAASLELGDVAVTLPTRSTSAGVKTDLLIDVTAPSGPDGPLVVTFGFDRALFEQSTVERMRDGLDRVIGAFVEDQGQRLSGIAPMSGSEELSLEQQETGPRIEAPETILDPLAATVSGQPDAVALIDDTSRTTFGELSDGVHRIATHVAVMGAAPGDRVAIALPRTSHAVTAVLGVLRAGAVAVPIDMSHPGSRIRDVLDNAAPAALITDDPQWARGLVEGSDVHGAMRVATPDDVLRPVPAKADRPAPPSAQDVAYLVYTSGTTGAPKGVQVPHSALANVFAQHAGGIMAEVRSRPDSDVPRMLHLTGFGFDAAWDPILWLVHGSTLYIADERTRADAEGVVRAIVENEIDVVETTPSYVQQLVTVGLLDRIEEAGRQMTLALGGESVPPGLWNRIAEHEFVHGWNLYGPSEVTIDSIAAPVEPGPVNIGAPVANLRARVLDRRLRRVPFGVEGELYLSGPSLAHGYRAAAGETSARFVADPEGDGASMYRTGDIVRRRAAGELEFLRREDDQVKIRGYRIEIGEVVAALERAHGARSAVVRVLTPGSPGTARLVAWVAGNTSSDEVQRAAQSLPVYMIPSSITIVERIPLTQNGKVDTDALPEPAPTAGSEAPTNDDERTMCRLLAEVLDRDAVGPHDDFFALGGHSLLVVALAARIREAFDADLPIRTIFDAPTPAGLLAAIGHTRRDAPRPATDSSRGVRAWVAENPRVDGEELPLSSNQERLWFLNQLDPRSADYSVVLQVGLDGDLDVGALSGALDDLVERHEVLRTTYPEVDGRAVQRIQRAQGGVLGDDAVDPAEGFDLAADLPIRAGLVSLGSGSWRLDLVMHHIATDGASLVPLARDLSTAYASRHGGVRRLQRPLPVQYSDFARWQRDDETVAEGRISASAAAWTERLAGVPTELDLPADGRREESAERAAEQAEFTIPAAVAGGIRGAGASARATDFHTFLASLAGYFHRIGAGSDVVIGSPSAGRQDPDVADLIGFFVNTLPLRLQLQDDPTFVEAIALARDTTLHAMEHQSVPFERIVEAVGPDRRLGRHPLFQTMLSVEEDAEVDLNLAGVEATPINPGTTGSAKVDLSFTLRPQSGGDVRGILEYDASMFSDLAAHGIVDRWISFLESIVETPERPISEVRIGDGEVRLEAWDRRPEPRTLFETFARTVSRFPDETALVSDGSQMDTRALDARINEFVAGLVSEGIRPGDLVALALPRTPDSVAALLAVWRTRAVAVPIDVELPFERIVTLLRTAEPHLVLHAGGSEPERRDRVLAGIDAAGLPAGRGLALDGLTGTAQPGPPPEPDDAAYIIFTSGTTGEPKGVRVPHKALNALAMSHGSTLMPDPVRRRVRLAHTTGVGFDASMDPILWLIAGHEVHLVSDDVRRDPQALASMISQQGITAWETTPSYVGALLAQTSFAQMLDERDPEDPFLLLLGGEPVDQGLWTWLQHRSSVTAWNLYGPTEAGVDSMVAEVDASDGPVLGAPTVGTRAYVLDTRMRPAPVGALGQLWIAGPQLADGYIGRPAETAEHFVADPFAADGSRMYRTGDLVVVRDTPDGERPAVVSRGRGDHQVKIRGHRVELGEVVDHLRGARDVSQAVVLPIDSGHQDALGAWVVPAQHTPDDAELVRASARFMRERVPEYMIPVAFAVIDAVPLTTNGKVDERALPPLRPTGGEGREPDGREELAVAAAFARTLDVADVRADDSFFTLGGHSFVAQPTVREINRALGSALPVQSLFQAPTVAALAELAGSGGGDVSESLRPLLRLRSEGEGAPLFAVHPASGLAWKFSTLVTHLATTRPIFGLQMPGIAPDGPEPETVESLDGLLDSYLRAIRSVRPHGPYHLVGFSFGGRLAHHLAARLVAEGEEVETLGVLDAYPTDHSALSGVTGNDQMWRRFLDANGIEAPAGPLDARTVLALLDDADNPFSTIPLEVVERMVRRFRLLGDLLDSSRTPEFTGHMHVFEATEEIPVDRPSPSSWHPYVTGEVTTSTVGVRHADMLSDRALDDIGPVLDRLLDHRDGTNPSDGRLRTTDISEKSESDVNGVAE